ncbi:MAG: hypothetical protein ABW185_30260 [Sedimenticola sp.]
MRPPTIEVTAAPDGNIVPLQSMNDLQHHGDQHIVLNAGFKIPSPTRRGVAYGSETTPEAIEEDRLQPMTEDQSTSVECSKAQTLLARLGTVANYIYLYRRIKLGP